jgi:PIN domain nuclease of toxin-antitoxin system
VRLLLDTHLLIWAAQGIEHVPAVGRALMEAPENDLYFSVASLWEIAVKQGLRRSSFQIDARILRRCLIDSGYNELAIFGEHAVTIDMLPPIHKDPFDRLLIAQAAAEGMILLTNDAVLSKYPGPVRLV